MKNYHVYVENKEKFLKEINKEYHLKGNLKVDYIDNGILLPPKKIIDNERNGVFAGGVVTSGFKFVGGLIRKINDRGFNVSCYSSYKVGNSRIEYRDEEVIFGGILIHMFGHTLIEGFSRLWYVLKNRDDKRKIVFLKLDEKAHDFGFLKLLNLDNEIEIIEKPMKFKKIIVPQESFHAYSGYYDEYLSIYDEMGKNIEPSKYKKIYLTRTQLEKKDCINEEYFEEFYKNLGYEVIAPEKYSIEEQIAFFKGAEEVACTVGSLSHMTLFCKNNIKLTILNRTPVDIITPQFIIEQAKNFEVNLIDISMNILPTTHRYGGMFLFMPNDNWKEYIKDNKYEKFDNISLDKEKLFYEYMVAWAKVYYLKNKYKYIYTKDIGDLLQNINKYILKEEGKSRKELYKFDVSKCDLLKVEEKKKKRKNKIKNILLKLGLLNFVKKVFKLIRK